MDVVTFDEPVDVGEKCVHCGEQIVATGRVVPVESEEKLALYRYMYRHIDGEARCGVVPNAEPFDNGQRADWIEEVLAKRGGSQVAAKYRFLIKEP